MAADPGVSPRFVLASGVTPHDSSPPGGTFAPSQIAAAYRFNNVKFGNVTGDGSGQTIAIVDAYDDPNIQADLDAFDTQFGLLATKVIRVDQTGGTNYPTGDGSGGWELEESLDVEWAHAMAPGATILLVEANSNSNDNMLAAVNYAAKNASVVSMSWGGPEYSTETSDDATFNVPGVTFVASSGDKGAPASWPATSPYVVAVGGTSLTLGAGNAWSSEVAWSGSGGGPSQYEPQPAYQSNVVTQTNMRGSPDVAYDADPTTGFAVYDSYTYQGQTLDWTDVGGTSAGAPQWAAIMAIANQGRAGAGQPALNVTSPEDAITALYLAVPNGDFHDITSGTSAGNPNESASPGYDLATGIGSPLADEVVSTLSGVVENNPAGQPDITFGTGGTTSVNFGGNDTAAGMAIQADGKYVVAGGTTANGNAALARFNADGSLDTIFGSGGAVTLNVPSDVAYFNDVAIQPNGDIVAVGNVAVTNTTSDSLFIARFLPNGALDTTFGTGGKVFVTITSSSPEAAEAVAIQPDGKIVVAGYADSGTSGNSQFALIRLTTAGSLDSTFGSSGVVKTSIGTGTVDTASALVLQPDGGIVVAGQTNNPTSKVSAFALVRYTAAGSLDSTFGTGGIVSTSTGGLDFARAIAIQADLKIVVAGHATVGSAGAFALARYNTNGSLDGTFGSTGTKVDSIATDSYGLTSLAIQANGKIVAAGTTVVNANEAFAVIRYNADGSRDATFGTNGTTTTNFSTGSDIPTALVINGSGAIAVAGSAATASNGVNFALARYLGDPIPPLLYSTWTPIGPAPIINGEAPPYTFQNPPNNGGSPVSGPVAGIAASPTDPNTIYIAAANGGVWKTTNGGVSWVPLTDNQATLHMGAIAIAPSNPQVIYAGTGEANSLVTVPNPNFPSNDFAGVGILKSTDAGATWTLLGSSVFNGRSIAKIVVDPTDANIVYVAVGAPGINGLTGNTGIWKSTDGGQTWTNTTTSISTFDAFTDLVMDPRNAQVLYAAVGQMNVNFYDFSGTGDAANGVYITKDGGASWTSLNIMPNGPTNAFPGGTTDGRIALAISDPAGASAATLYASIVNSNQFSFSWGGLQAMETSTDGGTTWTQLSSVPNYLGFQGYYASTLIASPTNPKIIFAGGNGLGGGSEPGFIESTDGGQSWTDITNIFGSTGPHPSDLATSFAANGNLLVGTDGGVWELTNPSTSGPAWSDLNSNLQITGFVGGALDPVDPYVAYGGSDDNGTEKYTGSQGWQLIDSGSDGYIAVNPTNPNTIYQSHSTTGFGPLLQRSTDGGATWNALSPPTSGGLYYSPYTLDPTNPNRILFGSSILVESTNGGSTWSTIASPGTGGFNSNDAPISSVTIAPSAPNTIYITAGGALFVTTNDGGSWTAELGFNASGIANVTVDPSNAQTAYYVQGQFGGSQILETTNGGSSWTSITGNLPNLPVYSLAVVHSFGTTQLFAGTDAGVYVSYDSGSSQGTTWAPYATGLPNAQVVQLQYYSNLNVLAAVTNGRGMWLAKVAGTDIQMQSAVASGTTLTVQYQITGAPATAFGIGLYEAPNSSFQPTVDSLVSSIQITSASDLTIGMHTKFYTLGSGVGQVALPGAGASDSGNGNYLLAVANYQDSVVEYSDDPSYGENTTVSTGIYHTTGGVVEVDTGDQGATIALAAGAVQVTINGTATSFTPSDVTKIIVRTHGGNDTITVGAGIPVPVTIYGGVGDDTVTAGATNLTLVGGIGADSATINDAAGSNTVSLSPGSGLVSGSGYAIHLSNMTNITVNGSGTDTVDLYDSSAADKFTASPTAAQMSGLNYSNRVTGFKSVTGHSAGGGSDSATLSDSSGKNTFTATPTSASFSGTGLSETAQGFVSVTANAASGTTDTATLSDTAGKNTFIASPTTATFSGPGFSEIANGFTSVTATAATGTTDSAILLDSTGNDTFTASPTIATMKGTGYSNRANGFVSVTGTSTAGGADSAHLSDTSGSNLFTATPTVATFGGTGFSEIANGFGTVYGTAAAGTTDSATLSDTSGSSTFSGTPTYGLFSGKTFYNQATGFVSVLAHAASGTTDTATLSDTTGKNTFSAAPTTATFSGTGFSNTATAFRSVIANAVAGTTDAATLFDASGNDTFTASPTVATMQGTGYSNRANGFVSVTGMSTSGGTDSAHLSDASGSNTFTATPTAATFIGTGFTEIANSFEIVYGTAAAGTTDSATLSDTSGSNAFTGTPTYGLFSGKTFYNQATGFASVVAHAAAGTTDTATLSDTTGKNTFSATPTTATFSGTGFANTATSFTSVIANAAAGTTDTATLFDSTGNDTFTASPTFGTMKGTGYSNRANGFATVTGTSTAGGTDSAHLSDTSGSNTFTATPTTATFSGNAFTEIANSFGIVYGTAAAGTTDKATLSDTSGSNTFSGTPTYGLFSGKTFYNQATGFASVVAHAAAGTTDTATLSDTSGKNTLSATPTTATFSGSSFSNTATSFTSVIANAASGTTDTATLFDSSGNDTFTASPTFGTMKGTGYSNRANGFATVTGTSTAGGTDSAHLSDTSGSNTFTATPTTATFSGTGFTEIANGFGIVYGTATAGSADSATLSDTSGSDAFTGTPTYGLFSGKTFYNQATGFVSVLAHAAAGTTDTATLSDTTGKNTFSATPTTATFSGTSFSNTATNFTSVIANATSGTTDTATLFDSTGNDTFTASPTFGTMKGTGYSNRANGFATVTGTSTAGGTDSAHLSDTSGSNTFTATPTTATFSGTGFTEIANGFGIVYGTAAAGTTDSATLSDTSGSNTFTGTPTYGLFSGKTFYNQATGFASVVARAAAGTTDTATLSDTTGKNTFSATPTAATFSGTGFSNTATSFTSVVANAAAGTTDSATLFDSTGNDTFTASPTFGTMKGTGYSNRANGFATVTGTSTAGGTDSAHLSDTSGTNTFTATPTTATFSGTGFAEIANGFGVVYGTAAAKTTDSATLSDTSGSNSFSATPISGIFSGAGFYNTATGFISVVATAAAGTSDTATLSDTSGSNTFTATPTTATFSGQGFSNSSIGFMKVTATAASGTTDTANFSDSTSSPGTFTGAPTTSSMKGSAYNNVANGFVTVSATAANSSDVANLSDNSAGAQFNGSGTAGALIGPSYTINVTAYGTVNITGATGATNKVHAPTVNYTLNKIGTWTAD
jgi:uncharacterized delta-60 repeat protein